jgi:hypothetical protein
MLARLLCRNVRRLTHRHRPFELAAGVEGKDLANGVFALALEGFLSLESVVRREDVVELCHFERGGDFGSNARHCEVPARLRALSGHSRFARG